VGVTSAHKKRLFDFSVKDKCWAVLFLGKNGTAQVRCFGQLDYWLGEYHGSSDARKLNRLRLVSMARRVVACL
jgi:hypothetical protein